MKRVDLCKRFGLFSNVTTLTCMRRYEKVLAQKQENILRRCIGNIENNSLAKTN